MPSAGIAVPRLNADVSWIDTRIDVVIGNGEDAQIAPKSVT